jgi:hypothetical protein
MELEKLKESESAHLYAARIIRDKASMVRAPRRLSDYSVSGL